MNNRIDYWFWENVFDEKQIKKINNIIDNNFEGFEPENCVAKDLQGNKKKHSIVKVINFKELKTQLNDFKNMFIHTANLEFGYEIFDIKDFEKLNFNIYSSKNNSKYDWHIDTSKSNLYDTKLTVLINLSMDVYEGGQFELFSGNHYEVPQLSIPGNAIMFKSYINHRVLPVTKGERRTLALFLNGPKFR
jgi:predicted 2-oxoglutarate/Fe(II)-dependent dioxygenase YbiX